MSHRMLARVSVVALCCLTWTALGEAQTIFEADFDTTFPTYGYSFDYAGEGDSTCAALPVSDDEVSSSFDVFTPPAATATFDTSGWDYPADACYTYAGWGLGIGYSIPTTTRLDSGNPSDYTMTFDASVAGFDPLDVGLDAQVYVVIQMPDTDGDGNLDDHRWGYNDQDPLRPFLTDTPQNISLNLGDLPFISQVGDLDFSVDYPQGMGVQLIVQPFGNAINIGVDADNLVTVDNVVFQGPTVTLPSGDFDGDMDFDCSDVDALVAEIVAGTNTPSFDMTGDGLVDEADLDSWLAAAGANNLPSGNPYLRGDANLDGSVDVSDFNEWNANKFTSNAAWCRGDFNANGSVDVSDFNAWNDNKFQMADGVASVPEPASLGLLGCAPAVLLCLRRRRS